MSANTGSHARRTVTSVLPTTPCGGGNSVQSGRAAGRVGGWEPRLAVDEKGWGHCGVPDFADMGRAYQTGGQRPTNSRAPPLNSQWRFSCTPAPRRVPTHLYAGDDTAVGTVARSFGRRAGYPSPDPGSWSDRAVVTCRGEMGRPPRINKNGGQTNGRTPARWCRTARDRTSSGCSAGRAGPAGGRSAARLPPGPGSPWSCAPCLSWGRAGSPAGCPARSIRRLSGTRSRAPRPLRPAARGRVSRPTRPRPSACRPGPRAGG
jgi:hypothetical protein